MAKNEHIIISKDGGLSDDEIASICEAELSDIDSESDLSSQNSRNMDYYMGDMDEYLPAGKDRSNVVTRDALDTVESVLPSIIKIFVDEENAVTFEPNSPQDEAQAKLETKAVRSCFFDKNEGFLLLYSFIKDALISKNSIIKSWWEEGTWEREEYENLDSIEAQKLLFDNDREYELIEYDEKEDGKIDLVMKCLNHGNVRIEVIPREEFMISRNANSVNPKLATFTAHKVQKTVSDLIEAGFDRDVVEALPTDEDYGEERLARRNLSDEQDYEYSSHVSMRMVWVSECYINIDRDDDGVAELLKVTLGGVGAGYKLLGIDEVDENPFVSATPVILTHKFNGFSLVDLVQDIQKIRTVLFRGILDNTYLANNLRMGANEKVNLDDLLVARPGGIVRTEGVDPPGNHISPIVHPPLPPEAFGLLEVLDEMVKNRVGVGDEVAGLDAASLADINTGVITQAYDMARMRLELMARIFAEIGLKPLFQDIHRHLHKNQSKAVQWKIQNEWVDIDPTHWREGRTAKVRVGLGHNSQEKKVMATGDILSLQEKALSTGLYSMPVEEYKFVHNSISERVGALGMDVDKFFPNPQTYKPKQQPPNPEIEFRKAELQLEHQKIQNDAKKTEVESQVKMLLAQTREREMAVRTQMENMKGQFQLEKIRTDEQNQVLRAMTDKQRAEFETAIAVRQQEWKEASETVELKLKKQEQDMEMAKAELVAATTLEETIMQTEQKLQAESMKHVREMMQMLQNDRKDREDRQAKITDWIEKNGSDRVKSLAKTLH